MQHHVILHAQQYDGPLNVITLLLPDTALRPPYPTLSSRPLALGAPNHRVSLLGKFRTSRCGVNCHLYLQCRLQHPRHQETCKRAQNVVKSSERSVMVTDNCDIRDGEEIRKLIVEERGRSLDKTRRRRDPGAEADFRCTLNLFTTIPDPAEETFSSIKAWLRRREGWYALPG